MDHIAGAGPLGRKTKVPIYIHEAVYEAKKGELDGCNIKYMDETSIIAVGDFIIKPFSTKHDAKHSLGFIIEEPATATVLCHMTDTGSISKTMRERTKECNAFYIEADYDEAMLADYEEYDQFLKDRISSNFGHLSNTQALEYLLTYDLDKVKHVIVGHISPRTNSPEKIMERVLEKMANYKDKFKVAPFEQPLQL
jgi:phosphoribosyl 1,2-cyclic phosphodiesterase